MSRVLISGGAGFIGSRLALFLLEHGYEVAILDILSTQIHGNNPDASPLYRDVKGKTGFTIGDVRDPKAWEQAIQSADYVVHLAAETGTGQSMYEVQRYSDVNIGGTAALWDVLTNGNHRVRKVVTASSRAIYGEGKYRCIEHGTVYPRVRTDADMAGGDFEVKCPRCGKPARMLPTDEDSEIHPISVYGFTKAAQEDLSILCGRSLGIPAVALRYQNVYGPGQSLKNPYTGILSIFSTRMKNGNPIHIFEDGTESRDFVYIDDVVRATAACLESPDVDYQRLNIGTGVGVDVVTVAETLKSLLGTDTGVLVTGNYRLGDIRHNVADISKARALLGWTPRVSFDEGISRFVQWVETQPVETDTYTESMEEMKRKGLFK